MKENTLTTRRTILTAAVWAAPAVTIAAAAPAFATSTVDPPAPSCGFTGARWRHSHGCRSRRRCWIYSVSVTCTVPVKQVHIDGVKARCVSARRGIWQIESGRCVSAVTVTVTTTTSVIEQAVKVA